MPNIKELLGSEKEIWVYLEKENYRDFFRQAKAEGFAWRNGKAICDNEEFRVCVSVSKDGKVAYVSCFALFGAPGKGVGKTNEQFAHIKKVKF